MTLELELGRDPHAPAIARAAARKYREDYELSPSLRQTLVLLVSEVVSNAVLHSRGPDDAPILLTINMTSDVVLVTVIDAGNGFTPHPRPPEATHGGYGLYLVDKSASRWGVDKAGEIGGIKGTRVWFELSRSARGSPDA
jgi:anti-sigma regulatory factor (Ser/Thr protein kinase)